MGRPGKAIHRCLATMRFPADFGISENWEGAIERIEARLLEFLPKGQLGGF